MDYIHIHDFALPGDVGSVGEASAELMEVSFVTSEPVTARFYLTDSIGDMLYPDGVSLTEGVRV